MAEIGERLDDLEVEDLDDIIENSHGVVDGFKDRISAAFVGDDTKEGKPEDWKNAGEMDDREGKDGTDKDVVEEEKEAKRDEEEEEEGVKGGLENAAEKLLRLLKERQKLEDKITLD